MKFSGRRALLAAVLRVPLSMVFVYGVFARVWWMAVGEAVVGVVTSGLESVEFVKDG